MRKRKFLLMMIMCTTIILAACTNGSGAVQTSGSNIVQPQELYPAYVMEQSEKKWGYIDEKGKFIIEPKYESASNFTINGMAAVSENGSYELIDRSMKQIMSSQYLYLSDFSEKQIIVSDGLGKSYLVDENGNKLFQTQGSIDKLSCGLAAFSIRVNQDKLLWGYINEAGTVIIEPKYEWAQAFSQDKAIVQITEGHFGIIDKEGKLLKEIATNGMTGLSEDTFVFSKPDDKNSQKYGYMTTDGTVMLDAIYYSAEGFEDGLAVVNAAADYRNEFGVINKKGEFVIPAKYGQIVSLKNGIYAVPMAQDVYYNNTFIKKALFDKTGKQLTDFQYYDLERVGNGLISATDDKYTYLLDDKGNAVSSIPKAEGIGKISPDGKLFKVEADNELYYLTQEGKKIWSSDNTIRFEGGLTVAMKTFRPDRCMLIQYPEVSGIADAKIQEKINGMLKDAFIGENKASNKDGEAYTDTIDIGFTADRNKDLLIISESAYFYPIGAAHGQPYREDYHIDIKNGEVYKLEDLFKIESKYKDKLTEIIKERIRKANQEYSGEIYYEDIGDLEANSGFRINSDAVRIYFYPYAIAAYAFGFPEFDISYDELKDVIDTEGALWKAFDREPVQQKKQAAEIYHGDKVKLQETIGSYEKNIIDAINSNDFKLVEPWLYPESSIYTSQKQLVAKLYQKQVKERLDSYSIDRIEEDDLGMVYRIYVTERIGIQYPGKDYTSKEFNWVYSARYNYENQNYQLTYIDKWEKK